MKCDVCQTGARKRKGIRYSLNVDGRSAVVENVPATVCEHCGEISLEPAIVDRLYELVRSEGQPRKLVWTGSDS